MEEKKAGYKTVSQAIHVQNHRLPGITQLRLVCNDYRSSSGLCNDCCSASVPVSQFFS